jgi:hypothetical protein
MMNRALVLVVLCVALTASIALVSAQPPAGGGGGGRGGGGMGNGMYLERTWTAVCFQLGLTNDQIMGLAPTFAAALDVRTKATEAARALADQTERRAAMTKAGDDCKATLDAKLATTLNADQLATLQKMMAPPQRRPQGQ